MTHFRSGEGFPSPTGGRALRFWTPQRTAAADNLAVAVVARGEVVLARVVGVAVVDEHADVVAVALRVIPVASRDLGQTIDLDVMRAECRHRDFPPAWMWRRPAADPGCRPHSESMAPPVP